MTKNSYYFHYIRRVSRAYTIYLMSYFELSVNCFYHHNFKRKKIKTIKWSFESDFNFTFVKQLNILLCVQRWKIFFFNLRDITDYFRKYDL